MDKGTELFLKQFEAEIGARSFEKTASPLLTTAMNSASLRRELADMFINLVVDESRLLSMVRQHRTSFPSGDITKLNVNTNVTRGATQNTEATETRRPTDSVVTYNTAKTVSLLDVSGEWVEDNVGGQGGKNVAIEAFTRAIANDMETLSIEGDDSETGTDDLASLIKVNDGWHVLTSAAEGAHIVDGTSKRTSYKLLSEMMRAMPTKWKRCPSDLRWLMSWGAAQDLVDEFASRNTLYGDQMRKEGTLPPILGVPVEIIPKIPEDLTLTGTDGTTGTFIWLCNPQNFIFVVQRDFKAEWERVPRKDADELTIHMRTDFVVEETDAVVKATDVSVYTGHGFYGAD